MLAAPATKRGASDLLAALPEDVRLNVLSRLRIKDLFLLAATCRSWLRFFTDPAVLRRLSPAEDQQGARLLGFFFQQTSLVRCERVIKDHRMQNASAFAPTFFATPWSPLVGSTDRALTSLVADDDDAFNYAVPLASRNGLVLMRLVPRFSSIHALSKTGLVYAICNPVTGERHITAPMDWPCFGLTVPLCYAIVTDCDVDLDSGGQQPSSRRHVFSELLVVTSYNTRSGHMQVHSYSAATRSWSVPATCPRLEKGLTVAWARTAVVHRGAAHWLYADHDPSMPTDLCILSAKVGTSSGSTAGISWTKLPAAMTVGQAPFLCVGRDGRFSIASVHGMHVALWTQQDAGDLTSWIRARLIRIPIEVPSPHPYAMVKHREWFEFNGAAMLVLFDGGAVFVLDLEKKVVEKLTIDLPPRMFGARCEMIVPYEMDLSESLRFNLAVFFEGKRRFKIVHWPCEKDIISVEF